MIRTIYIIAQKEIQDGLRNRWVLATSLLLAALSLSLAFLGSSPVGEVDASRLSITIVSLSNLSIFLGPLIALMLSYDAIVGDIERGTMLLVLTYPVSRWELILGKFMGHLSLIALSIIIGYGIAGLAIGLTEGAITFEEWKAYLALILSSIMLGGAFIAIGYLISVLVTERATAAGIAVGVWLLFVLLYDMALLGIIVADQGKTIDAGLFNFLLMSNPADAFRIFNLTGFDQSANLAGMAAVAGNAMMPLYIPLLALLFWTISPLLIAGSLFSKKEI